MIAEQELLLVLGQVVERDGRRSAADERRLRQRSINVVDDDCSRLARLLRILLFLLLLLRLTVLLLLMMML